MAIGNQRAAKMKAYKIVKNQNYSSDNDTFIEGIEGPYGSFVEAVKQARKPWGRLRVYRLPDGNALLYDLDMSDEQIRDDVDYLFAVGCI
jgi:hypothetical protein